MTRLYALDLRPFQDGSWRDLLPLLPQERQTRALACRFDADRARVTGSGWLLQYALQQAGLPAAEQIFSKTAAGKPVLLHQENLHFSLSHSGHWTVCAIGDQPLGADVELPRCTMRIAERHFCPEELEGLLSLPEHERRDQLNRLWTAKEAYLKALGCGLSIPLTSFTVRLTEDGAFLEQALSPLPYRLHEYRQDCYRLCLCTVDDRPDLTLVTA